MTSLSLSFWIAAGVAAQVAIVLLIAFRRHWREYVALRERVNGGDSALDDDDMTHDAAQIAAWQGFRTFVVTRKIYEDANRSIASFYLEPEDGAELPPFDPGQFLTYRLTITGNDDRTESLVRTYSLSDAPNPHHYRSSIKRVASPPGQAVPPGRISNFMHDHIDVGSRVELRAPMGRFVLRRGNTPVVLIAGGIGVTPLLSMLNWCAANQPQREIWLFYGVRDGREMIMTAHLADLAAQHKQFHLRLCFSAPAVTDVMGQEYHHHGRITVDLLRLQLPLGHYDFYICGPQQMIQSLVSGLSDWLVPDDRIHFEAFGPSFIKRPAGGGTVQPAAQVTMPIKVTFAKSGRDIAWSDSHDSLLGLAEANGIAIDSGCRSGACGTCQTKVISGQVAYLRAVEFSPDPGTCVPCSCTPLTDLTLEA